MAGRYCSSNIKFNMDDENQRRTWEYLKQSNHKTDGSYAKILSDAFIKAISTPSESVMAIPADIAKQIIDEVRLHFVELDSSIAKEHSCEEEKVIRKNDDNNDESQEIPAGMMDFFMGQGT